MICLRRPSQEQVVSSRCSSGAGFQPLFPTSPSHSDASLGYTRLGYAHLGYTHHPHSPPCCTQALGGWQGKAPFRPQCVAWQVSHSIYLS